MLVVTRKVGESLIIRAGKDTITVSVEALHGGNVRIGLMLQAMCRFYGTNWFRIVKSSKGFPINTDIVRVKRPDFILEETCLSKVKVFTNFVRV